MILLSAKTILKAVLNLERSAQYAQSLEMCTSRGQNFESYQVSITLCNLINSNISTPNAKWGIEFRELPGINSTNRYQKYKSVELGDQLSRGIKVREYQWPPRNLINSETLINLFENVCKQGIEFRELPGINDLAI